jgi:hypothetical protein
MKVTICTASLLLLCLTHAIAQRTLIYQQQTAKQIVRIEVSEKPDVGGLLLKTIMSNGEWYSIQNDIKMATLAFSYGNAEQRTLYSETREGNELRLVGTVKGKPISRVARIDGLPVYQSVERSLQGYAISGSSQTLYFWMVLPMEASVFRLMARREGREIINVAGAMVEAEKVKVSLTGVISFLWSSIYWYRPTDGTFLKSECVRGIIGTPKTVIELVEGIRL